MRRRTDVTIMALDANTDDLRRLVGELRDHGFRTLFFSDGQIALVNWLTHSCDALVTNIPSPRMNGCQLSRAVKRLNPNVPVVYVTNLLKFAQFFPAQAARVDAVFEKPVDYGEVLSKLDELLGFINE